MPLSYWREAWRERVWLDAPAYAAISVDRQGEPFTTIFVKKVVV
jgi:hypothetical protein